MFPIRPRAKKPPAVASWETRATTDPGQIRRWWTGGGMFNAGIACGPSGLIVIDLDTPKPGQRPPAAWALPGITDGAGVLAALCQRHGQPFPDTFTVTTARGGRHLYFTAPPGVRLGNTSGDSARGLGWLIDTRAHGGYVVAPGSAVDLPGGTGRYQVTRYRPPAPLPGWLDALLTAPPTASPIGCHPPVPDQVRDLNRYARAALNREMDRVRAAVEGGRNHALNKAAYNLGQLIAAGILPGHLARTALYDAASVHFDANPPLTPAEARATIDAALSAGQRHPRALTAGPARTP